ncbi:MAG: polysaccharide biosynthesis/export family protein [Oligoflexus sp.]
MAITDNIKFLMGVALAIFSSISLQACSHRISAEDISKLQAGKTFDRQGVYRIGVGDEISVRVFGDQEISGNYIVSPTGFLHLPLIDPIQVAGLSSAQLTTRLKNALQRLIKDPRVTIALTGVRSFQVYFAGEVNRVGAVNLTNETSFLQAITLGGGLTEFASGRIVLIRKVDQNKVRRFSTTYERILAGKDSTDYITLESGDVIFAE